MVSLSGRGIDRGAVDGDILFFQPADWRVDGLCPGCRAYWKTVFKTPYRVAEVLRGNKTQDPVGRDAPVRDSTGRLYRGIYGGRVYRPVDTSAMGRTFRFQSCAQAWSSLPR